ncbi:MAG: Smr/MutS family protein [Bacilli bacterium]|nr:Smr/MutS family protein [Bacilli bacterium]MDD3895630.1 Smr/MutS family protein [Bacilli bacterium]MDD4407707.1 Smr/MutS family protein [Bacilli bacterium]
MNPFLNILPTIDVHGYTSDLVIYPVSDFINDNIKLKKDKIVIVHGIGKGILKNTIRNNFRKDKRIKKLYGDPFNLGITIIELNI